MTRFMARGAHAKAMKVANEMGDPSETKVYGYETDKIPTWDEALALWSEHGTRHGVKVVGGRNKNNKNVIKSNGITMKSGSRSSPLPLVTVALVCSAILFAGTSFFTTTTEAPAIVEGIL